MNNDRLKFRVWYNCPFVNEPSHYLYYDPSENNYQTDIIRDASCDNVEDIIYYDLRDIILGNIDEYENEDRFIVEQCTGLRDKNGNLMYAGDRVRAIIPDSRHIGEMAGYSEYTKETTGIIKWNDRCAGFVIEDVNEDLVFFYEIADSEDIEIIGNVHQTKD